jgi:hypothetical protein
MAFKSLVWCWVLSAAFWESVPRLNKIYVCEDWALHLLISRFMSVDMSIFTSSRLNPSEGGGHFELT